MNSEYCDEPNPEPNPAPTSSLRAREVGHRCVCGRVPGHLTDHQCALCRSTWGRDCAMCAAEQLPGRCAHHERPHEDCHRAAESAGQTYLNSLNSERARHAKAIRFAGAVRQMVGPGVKRKTLRVDELRALVDEIYGEGA